MVAGFFRARNSFAKIGLWVLVGMIAVGLLGSTVAWYLGSDADQLKPEAASPQQEVIKTELEKQEALREQYEGMLASNPDDLAVLTGFARVEIRLGELYLQNEKPDQGKEAIQRAATFYQKALKLQDDPQMRLELAGAYMVLGEKEQSAAEMEQILEHHPDNIQVLIQMATALESWGDSKGALNVWKKIASSSTIDQETKDYAQSRVDELQEKE